LGKAVLNLAGIMEDSIVDGPGLRTAIFAQGCPRRCEGCHNPQSHDFSGGYDCEPEKILAEIRKNPLLDGVTFSGGEPLCQAAALLPLAKEIKKMGLNLFIYTGSVFESLLTQNDPDILALLREGDFLVDGPYVQAQRDLTLLFRGSQNQRILDLPQSLKQGKGVLAAIGQ
jgi:anaerobic ribonucleoside-triphosphate reductase activating protein